MTDKDITTEGMLEALSLLEKHQDGLPECMYILELEAIRSILLGYDTLRIDLANATERAKSLEAELERARPLLEAIDGVKVVISSTGRYGFEADEPILRAALAYREGKART